MAQVSFLVFQHLSFLVVLLTSGLSGLNAFFFNIRATSLSSFGGFYLVLVIMAGMVLRCYLAGIDDTSTRDYDRNVNNSAVLTTIANLLILIGFNLSIWHIGQVLISLILCGYWILRTLLVFNDNVVRPQETAPSWNARRCWRREFKVVVFITILAIAMEYISFANGGLAPSYLLF